VVQWRCVSVETNTDGRTAATWTEDACGHVLEKR